MRDEEAQSQHPDNKAFRGSRKKEPQFDDKPTKQPSPRWMREAIGVGVVLSAVFLFLALLQPKVTGIVGEGIHAVLKFGFGVAAYPVVLLMLGCGVLMIINGWSFLRLATLVLTGSLWCAVVFESFKYPTPRAWTWPLAKDGGGWIGALLEGTLFRVVGIAGLWSMVIGCALVWVLFTTQKSLWGAIRYLLKRRSIPMQTTQSTQRPAPKPAKTESAFIVQSDMLEKRETVEKERPVSVPVEVPSDRPVLTPSPTFVSGQMQAYEFPPLDLLDPAKTPTVKPKDSQKKLDDMVKILEMTLDSFNVTAKVVHVTSGPAVTRFELEPGVGVKITKITSLAKDIALKLAVLDVRIEAPIPGKALVGIEVPNLVTDMVVMRTIIEKTEFYQAKSKLVCTLGLTITGEPVLMDLAKMPHVLIAGATGAGKSVCVNALILSILMRATPQEVKFLMIDPKKVELSLYDGIPHLVAPVVTDPHKAAATLNKWALVEMERRYETFSKLGVKNIEGYNERVAKTEVEIRDDAPDTLVIHQPLPYIVVIIDELADLMMVASQEVENTICRLAQMARATGIHLVVATQRPSVDVVTGLIKANVPSRVSFFLQSQIDSRTILDMPGAEKLLGKGDMLYSPVGAFKPQRIQGVYVSEQEVKKVVAFLQAQSAPNYLSEVMDVEPLSAEDKENTDEDPLLEEAKQMVMSTQYASTSYLQRKLRIGYNRASRLMDELERLGLVDRRQQGRGG